MQRREKGSGSIWYSEDRKRWIAQFSVGVMPNGSKKLKTITGKTKKEVKEKMKLEQAKLLTGTYLDKSSLTIVEVANSINDNKKALNIVGGSGYKRNKDSIKIIENSSLCTIPIQKLTEPALTAFLSSITNYSNSVIGKVYGTVNSSLKKSIQLGIININPMDDITCPKSDKPTKKIRSLSMDEQKKLIDALNNDNKEPYRSMILLSLFSGMRMGEVAALSVNNVNLQFKSISINKSITRDENDNYIVGETTKTYAGIRTIQMDNAIYTLLSSFIDNTFIPNDKNLLFINPSKKEVITSNQVNCYFKRLITRYNISDSEKGYNQHMLRHTYATRCIESGMPAKIVQRILGHTDIRITLNTYCDVFDTFENKYIEQAQSYLAENGIAIN